MQLPYVSAPVAAVLAPLLETSAPRGDAVFDADGTLWRGDVGEDFLRFLVAEDLLPEHAGESELYAEYEKRLAGDPADAYAFAVAVMAGMDEGELTRTCETFFARRFLGRLFPFTRPILEALHRAGHRLWIVSASPRWIVEAGARSLGLDPGRVIGVDCEVEHGRLTRRVRQPLPFGVGKVRQLEARGLKPLLAFGNGEFDLPMLEYSGRAVVVAPHDDPGNSLVRAAVAQGWPVQRG